MLPDDVTQSDEMTTDLGQAGAMLFAELAEAKAVKAAAEERIAIARKAIEHLAGEARTILVGGNVAATWKPQVARRMDQATVRRVLRESYGWTDEQIDAGLYVEVESRQFRLAS